QHVGAHEQIGVKFNFMRSPAFIREQAALDRALPASQPRHDGVLIEPSAELLDVRIGSVGQVAKNGRRHTIQPRDLLDREAAAFEHLRIDRRDREIAVHLSPSSRTAIEPALEAPTCEFRNDSAMRLTAFWLIWSGVERTPDSVALFR